MKFNKGKMALLLSAVLLAVNSLGASAIKFGDLQGYLWAEKYIEDTSNKGIINGYPDGTFRPGSPVSRIESLILVANLYPKQTIDGIYKANLSKYKSKLDKAKIEEWSRPYIVFALNKGIIPDTDAMLASLVDSSTKKPYPAMRYEVAVFIIRGLAMEGQLNKSAKLSYLDTKDINPNAIPYIELLQRKGIISKLGDGTNRFNPNKTITRAETAVMFSNAYKYSEKAKSTPNTSTANPMPTTPATSVVQSLKGTISLFTMTNTDINVSATLDDGKSQSFVGKINGFSVKSGNTPKAISDLRVGQKAEFVVVNGLITEVRLDQEVQKVSGKIMELSSDFKTITISNNDGNKVLTFNDNSKIYLNDNIVSPKDLTKESMIDAYYENNIITRASVVETKRVFEGEIYEYTYNNISINDSKNGKITKNLSNDVKIYKNDKRVDSIGSLAVGDIAKITLENDKVNQIEVTANTNKYMGAIINSIQINSNYNKLIITDREGKEHNLTINNNTIIRINDKRVSIYDLKVGYEVDIYAQGGTIDEITSRGQFKQTTVNGTVTDVDIVDKYVEIKQNDGKIYKLYYNSSTTKIEQLSNGMVIDVNKINKGDEVTGIGVLNGGNIEATRIIVNI